MTVSQQELQQKLQDNRVAVEKLELKSRDIGYVEKNAGVIVWNNVGVVLLCKTIGRKHWISIQLYDHENKSKWLLVYSVTCRNYRLNKALQKAQAAAEDIAQKRAAGWKFSRTTADGLALTIRNPIDGSVTECRDHVRAFKALKALPLSPVEAITNAIVDIPAVPEAVQQALQLSIANQHKTEVKLLSARHHNIPSESLLETVENVQIHDGESLLAAVEKAHRQGDKALSTSTSNS